MIRIDLNSDVGEGMGNEAQLMPLLSSCNIACGGHAGDETTMIKVLALAKKYNVKVGAHPSYPDRSNFGRKEMAISDSDLKQSLTAQILSLKKLTIFSNVQLHHIKPHGALYNKAAQDAQMANLIIDTILGIDDQLTLYVPYNSLIAQLAAPKLKIVTEGFADRAYNEDYSLVSRHLPNAVLTKSSEVITHVLPMIQHNTLTTIDGKKLPITIDTLCVHGDTKNALTIVTKLREKLIKEGLKIA